MKAHGGDPEGEGSRTSGEKGESQRLVTLPRCEDASKQDHGPVRCRKEDV